MEREPVMPSEVSDEVGRFDRFAAVASRFASRAYAGAFDIRSVQELLGHSSPAVTARYVAVPSTQLVNAVLAVPPIPGIGPPSGPQGCSDSNQPMKESATMDG